MRGAHGIGVGSAAHRHRSRRVATRAAGRRRPALVTRRVGALLLVTLALGCSSQAETPVEDRVVTVACARCIFEMEGVSGCPWAAEIDGEHYLMRGPLPADHLTHAPDGICNMRRQARVDGFIRGELLHVTRVELLEAENVPAEPRFGPEDIH